MIKGHPKFIEFVKKYPDVMDGDIISLKRVGNYVIIQKELIRMGLAEKNSLYDFIRDFNGLNIDKQREEKLSQLLD